MTLFSIALCAAGCSARDVCDGVSGTCLTLHVTGMGIDAVDQLTVSFGGAFTANPKSTLMQHKSLPVDVAAAISAPASGPTTAHVIATVGADSDAAEGSTGFNLVPGHQRVTISLVVAGADFAMIGDLAGVDMTSPIADLSADSAVEDLSRVEAGPPDLVPPPLGCQSYWNCLKACSDSTCTQNCTSKASSHAITLFTNLTSCSIGYCNGGGSPPDGFACVDQNDRSTSCLACVMAGAGCPCMICASEASACTSDG
jgi:hypothetical protein